MARFAIIEVNDSLTIAQVTPGQLPEDTARQERGALVDPFIYRSYDHACEVLHGMQLRDAERLGEHASLV